MGILDQIYKAVQETSIKVNELVEWKAGMDEHILNQDRMINGVRKTVYGNPDNGLVSKVQRLLNCKKSSKESSTSRRDFWLYILQRLIVVATLSLAGFLLMLYHKFGKGN